MKKIITNTLLLMAVLFHAQAQFDLTDFATISVSDSLVHNNLGYLYYSDNFNNLENSGLHTVDLTTATGPDTIFFPVTVAGEIIPSSSPNGLRDTLTLDIAVGYWGRFTDWSLATTNAYFTIKNKFNSYSYSNISRNAAGSASSYDQFKFVEGEADTIMVIVTAGLFSLDHMKITSTNATVLTNAGAGVFEDENTLVTNPVVDGQLIINIGELAESATVALFSLDGQLIDSKEISATDNTFDVSALSGMYLLRDMRTGSMKKVVIK